MAVPAFVRASAVATGTTSPLAVTITAAASGNTLIAFVSNNRGASTGRTISSITATSTTGWTELGAVSYGNSRVAIWYGNATGTTGTSVSITFSGTVASGCTAYVEEWSGILTSLTIAGATATTNTNTGTTASMTSFTPLQKDSWCGACVGAQSGTAPSASPGAPWANAKTGGANTSNIGGVTQQLNSASAQSGQWTVANVLWGTVVGELRSQTLTISVSDSVTVTESVTVTPQTLVSVNDTTAATAESVTVTKVCIVSPNDTVTVTENLTVQEQTLMAVNDAVTVVDIPVYPIHDDVTVTESVTISIPTANPLISVFDSSSITEAITIVVVDVISVGDDIATGNNYPVGTGLSSSVATDISGASPFIAPFSYSIGGVVLWLSRTGTTIGTVGVDLYSADGSGNPTGSSLTSGSFDGNTVLSTSLAPITISFASPVSLSGGSAYAIVVTAPGADDLTNWVNWAVVVNFAVLFSDQTCRHFSLDGGSSWSKVNTRQMQIQTLATDDVTITIATGNDKTVSVNDSSTVTESVTLVVVTKASVSDASTVTESNPLVVIDLPSVSDSSTVTESVSIVSIDLPSVFDSSTVTETTTEVIVTQSSVFDSSTVTESVVLTEITQLSVFDPSTVTENVQEAVQTSISVNDASTVTENVAIFSIDSVSVNDASTVTENISETVVTQLSVSDASTVTENVSLSIISPGTVFVVDSASVTESVNLVLSSITFLVFDSSTVTESVSLFKYTPGSGVAVEDRVNLGFRQGTSEADVLVGGFG